MPKFRRSPRRPGRSGRVGKEDGSFNFGPTVNTSHSYPQSESDRDISSDDDASYKPRFFRKSPTKKTRKSLQDQEVMVTPPPARGSILDVGAHDVIETQFVPFQAIKHALKMRTNDDDNDRAEIEDSKRRISMTGSNFSNDIDSDVDEGDDASFRSMNSLKIGAMNKAKRREFIKYHVKQQSMKAYSTSGTASAALQPSSSFTSKSILPSRSEITSEGINSFQSAPSDENGGNVDPWAPHISLDERDAHYPAAFDFPSDPFAEFDAQYAVDVKTEKMKGTSPVTNRVFGFTPTRKDFSPKKIIDRKKIGQLKIPALFAPPPPPLESENDIMDMTHDSSQIALASPQLDRRKFRHSRKGTPSPKATPSPGVALDLPSYTPSPTTGFHSPLRPMSDVNIDASSGASVSSSIGASIETADDLPVLHMADFMKLSEAERVQAYCDLFEVAADTMKDLEEKRQEIQSMGKKVDNLMGRVTDMESDKQKFFMKDINSKKEIVELKGILEANGIGIGEGTSADCAKLSSAGGTPNDIDMLRTELESKDIIIEALQRSMDEWKSQEKSTNEAIERSKSSQLGIGDKSNFTSAEVEKYRLQLLQTHQKAIEEMKSKAEENRRDSDAIIVEKEKKVKEQSALIQKQKTLIFEAREEIQQNGRTIDGLRVDVSSGDSAISELKSKLNNVGDMVELEAVHAELEETKQLVKTLQQDRDSVSGTQSVSSWTANSDPRSESAVQRAKRAFDVSIPTGTVKARVAMAASRFKNKTTVNQQTSYVKAKEGQDSTVKRSLATFNGSAIPSDMSGSWKPMTHNNRGVSEEEHQKVLTHLSEKTTIVEKLQLEMQIEIRKMVAEKTECEKQLHDMKGAYKVEIDNMRDGNSSFIQCLKVSHEKEIKVLLVEKSNLEQRLIDLENANSKDQSSTLSKIESERSSTTTSGKITKEDEHKFADLEDGYKAEIEGIISEKKELKQRLAQTVEAHKVELRRLVEEKILCEHSAEELKETHNEEIRRLSAEKQYFEQHISSLEQNLKDAEERYAQEAQESMSRIGNIVDAVTHEVGETTCEAEATAAPTTNPSSREVESVRKENQQLGNRVNALENEIETVGGLLEETIMSIKEKDDEIEALRDNVNATTNAGLLSRFGGQGGRVTEQKKITNLSQYTDDEIKQLERICKLHQLTIIRQRSQAKAMLKQLGEAKADKEKIAILEAQFAEVNKVLESKQMNSAVSADSGPDTMQASIIKVDAAFISCLEQKSEKDQGRVEELQHEVRILKDRIETMKEKMNVEIVLRAQVDDLTMALEARELEIKSLEEAYSSRRSIVTQASLQMSSSMKSFGDVDSEFEELTSDELRDIVSKRDKMIKKLKAKVAGLEQVSANLPFNT